MMKEYVQCVDSEEWIMVGKREKQEIDIAATEAVKAIATAASEATKVIASAAAEASKIASTQNQKSSEDHDLLIELRTKMDAIKVDIQLLNDGTGKKISDHEIRLNALEKSKTVQNTMMAIGIGLITLLASLMTYHMIK